MPRRSFSLMLAWRYLNPRRAMLSMVAMISVIGVMLGVLALVVVMSVYSGMEREVKKRFLGFIPHIRVDYAPGGMRYAFGEWRELAKKLEAFPGVSEAGPVVQDMMMIDIDGRPLPGTFQGVDTSSDAAVNGLEVMLDKETYPDSTADMGVDDRVVISSKVARAYGVGVGDTMMLVTTRNLEELQKVINATKRPPVREEFQEKLADVRGRVTRWTPVDDHSELSDEDFQAIHQALVAIEDSNPRPEEGEIIWNAVGHLEAAEHDDAKGVWKYAPEGRQEFLDILGELDATDVDKMDAAAWKNIEEYVLPKEAEIVGVYAASQMALTPDVFMPLHLAQELAGLEDEVQGIGIRLDDPYQARAVAAEIASSLGEEGWYLEPWMDVENMRQFSILIEQQRVMMYFVLSFIVLVSAFSMTAVMFTVTIQKRREIGVMKALGAAPSQIVRVFVYQGMVLGFFGSLTGIGLGLLVIATREGLQRVLRSVGFDPFAASFTGFSVLPAHVNPVEVAVIGVIAFVLCALAAWLPAFFAARADAARSLRNL